MAKSTSKKRKVIVDTSVESEYFDTIPFEFTDTSNFDLSTLAFDITNFEFLI